MSKGDWSTNISFFEQEIQDLQSALAIPGLAYVIMKEGELIASNGFGSTRQDAAAAFTTATPLRIASVTKSLTAVVVMQLVEEGRLDLDAPVRRYVPAPTLPDSVLVRHLLTHTSEGNIGEEYVYGTTRYAILGSVVEAVTGGGFDQVLRERILERSGMRVYASPSLGAHAGLVSTAGDMGAYLAALDGVRLLKPSSLKRLARPSLSTTGAQLPVSLGWFVQTVQGQRVMWSFGQDDPEHSGALLLYIPERNLSLFILANANVLSDPFRLLMGDVSKSPFAMSFLRLFIFSKPGAPLTRPERDAADLAQDLANFEERNAYSYRDELIGWALVDLWGNQAAEAQRKLDLAFSRYGEEPDAAVLFAALRFQDERFKNLAIRMGEQLLSAHPNNRWILLFQGYLLQQRERFEEASGCFQRILALPNQEPDFLDRLFKGWSWTALAQMNMERNPVQARFYAQKVVDSGIGGSLLEEVRRLLSRLN
jgi:CubicO group peptidase (beta-lactamase class C family)